MARPLKTGLDYFPFDIDFFEDEKITLIAGEFDIKGEITAVKLLCAIYRNGYFIEWNERTKFRLLKNLPTISDGLLESIVDRLVRWEFFDKTLFDSARILTSKGIQKRYFEASKRRGQKPDLPYLLVNVDNNAVNVCNNPVNVDKNPLKESKVKENKEEEREKEKAKTRFSPPTPEDLKNFIASGGYCVNAEVFYNHYAAIGWRGMADWQAAVRKWHAQDAAKIAPQATTPTAAAQRYRAEEEQRAKDRGLLEQIKREQFPGYSAAHPDDYDPDAFNRHCLELFRAMKQLDRTLTQTT